LCRLAKFQGVSTLTVFVASNQGDVDTTQVTKILMSGTTVQGMNVADIKKPDED
jgi:PITH domain